MLYRSLHNPAALALMHRIEHKGIAVSVVCDRGIEMNAVHPQSGHLIIVRSVEGDRAAAELDCVRRLSAELGMPTKSVGKTGRRCAIYDVTRPK
jgi:hypothetical protein